MKFAPALLIIFFLFIAVSSCKNDKQEDLNPPPNNNTNNDPCKTKGVTWTKEIDSIMVARCVACHGGQFPTAGIRLNTYAGVKANISKVLLCINHDASISSTKWMPKDEPKLDSCTIKKIEAWHAAGMPQ